MLKTQRKGFRKDVIVLDQRRERGVTSRLIVENLGISEVCLRNWLCLA